MIVNASRKGKDCHFYNVWLKAFFHFSLEMANIPGLPVRPARGKSMGLQDNGHIKINMDL